MEDNKRPLPTSHVPHNRRPHLQIPEHVEGSHPNHMHARVSQKPRAHHGPDGKRRYHYSHSLHILPTDLQKRVYDAHQSMSDIHLKQMNTPVSTNPAQCPDFPHPHQIKDDIRKARQAAIDDWHEENPDHRVEDHHG
jgi:hypothetical protein